MDSLGLLLNVELKSATIRFLGLGVAIAVISGCSSDPSVEESPYASWFEDARRGATSQFEKDALVDGEISRAEYEEAMQRYVACIADKGASVELEDQTGYYVYNISGDVDLYDSVADGCREGTIRFIEPLFVETFTNPQNLDFDELTAQCMIALKVVNPPFTKADFLETMNRSGAVTTNADPLPIDPRSQEIMDDQRTLNCIANPNYHNIFPNGEDN